MLRVLQKHRSNYLCFRSLQSQVRTTKMWNSRSITRDRKISLVSSPQYSDLWTPQKAINDVASKNSWPEYCRVKTKISLRLNDKANHWELYGWADSAREEVVRIQDGVGVPMTLFYSEEFLFQCAAHAQKVHTSTPSEPACQAVLQIPMFSMRQSKGRNPFSP